MYVCMKQSRNIIRIYECCPKQMKCTHCSMIQTVYKNGYKKMKCRSRFSPVVRPSLFNEHRYQERSYPFEVREPKKDGKRFEFSLG